MSDEIEDIINNIKFTDSVNKEIDTLKSKVEKLNSEISIYDLEIHKLYNGIYPEEPFPLKRTFGEILDEIARQNNISREHVNIKFEDKILGGYFYRKDETKLETVEKQLDRWGSFTLSFSVALNSECLDDMEPLFCIYPLTDKEKARRERLKKIRDIDPLYGEYTYNTRLFEIQKSGMKMLDHLRREHGISAEMAWFFSVEDFEDIFYYIEPKYIDLDEDNPFSKALRSLLTKEELKEYENRKVKYNQFKTNRDALIKEKMDRIDELKKKIKSTSLLIQETQNMIYEMRWPSIIINAGDFIRTIFDFNDTPINSSNAVVSIYGKKDKSDSYEYSDDVFTLRIKNKPKSSYYFNEIFDWKVNYSEEMTDGESIYSKVLKNNSFFNRNSLNCWKDIKNIQNFIMHFEPYYFFKDDGYLNKDIIRKVVIKCLLLENVRNGKINSRNVATLFTKYSELLMQDDCKPKNKLNKNSSEEKVIENYSKDDVLKLVRKNYLLFPKLDIRYRSDRDVAIEAIVMDGLMLEFVSESLKSDSKVVLMAIKANPYSIKFASNSFRDDDGLMLELVKINGLLLEFASPRIRGVKEFVMEAIKNNGYAIKFASDELKKDREVVLTSIRQNGAAIRYADESFFSDKEIVIEALRQPGTSFIMPFLSDDLRRDRDVILTAYCQDRALIKYASGDLKDELRVEFIKKATDYCLDTKQKVYKR